MEQTQTQVAQQPQQAPQQQVQPSPKEGRMTVYESNGQQVQLSSSMVRQYLVKGNGSVSDQDIILFISMCRFNQLNPFLNEAYLIKFANSPAQMCVSKEAFFKRADACPDYDGIEAGIIVNRKGEIIELDGMFYLPGDVLMGGWAKVYLKNRRCPVTSKVTMAEYDKKQSLWKEKPATMICKIAKVQALREAFPQQLGAMYTEEEESSTIEASYEDVSNKVEKKKEEMRKSAETSKPELM